MSYQEEYKFSKDDYMIPCGENKKNDIDDYLIKRYKYIKNKAELELETIEAHGIINPETAIAKADAETKIKLTNYLLKVKTR